MFQGATSFNSDIGILISYLNVKSDEVAGTHLLLEAWSTFLVEYSYIFDN